jgi:hypothetical protein
LKATECVGLYGTRVLGGGENKFDPVLVRSENAGTAPRTAQPQGAGQSGGRCVRPFTGMLARKRQRDVPGFDLCTLDREMVGSEYPRQGKARWCSAIQ